MRRSMFCLVVLAMFVVPVRASALDADAVLEDGASQEITESLPVMPMLHWDPETQVLTAGYPLPVVAWMRGEIDDTDGSLASWKERFDEQVASPGFARAMLTLQELLRERALVAGGGALELETVHIPQILSERLDIMRGLRGEQATMGIDDGDCFRWRGGTLECFVKWGPFCPKEECVLDGGSECGAWEPINCPDDEGSGPGSGGGDRYGELRP